jgi:hypothetical protein
MVRFFAASAALALAFAAAFGFGEVLPVDHREPITVRVLSGRSGLPLAHMRLVLVAGYDERDLARGLWLEEAATNADGEALVPRSLVNFPFLLVSLKKAKPCSSRIVFNMGRIRNDGFNAPNHCGTKTQAELRGTLTIFAREDAAPPSDAPAARRPVPSGLENTEQAKSIDPSEAALAQNFIQFPTELNQLPNELETLRDRESAAPRFPMAVQSLTQGQTIPALQETPVLAPQDARGTGDSSDAYQEMCLPER